MGELQPCRAGQRVCGRNMLTRRGRTRVQFLPLASVWFERLAETSTARGVAFRRPSSVLAAVELEFALGGEEAEGVSRGKRCRAGGKL